MQRFELVNCPFFAQIKYKYKPFENIPCKKSKLKSRTQVKVLEKELKENNYFNNYIYIFYPFTRAFTDFILDRGRKIRNLPP